MRRCRHQFFSASLGEFLLLFFSCTNLLPPPASSSSSFCLSIIITTAPTHHHQHNIIIGTPATDYHQHTISNTPPSYNTIPTLLHITSDTAAPSQQDLGIIIYKTVWTIGDPIALCGSKNTVGQCRATFVAPALR